MSDKHLRFECLSLAKDIAKGHGTASVIEAAKELYGWISSGSEPKQEPISGSGAEPIAVVDSGVNAAG